MENIYLYQLTLLEEMKMKPVLNMGKLLQKYKCKNQLGQLNPSYVMKFLDTGELIIDDEKIFEIYNKVSAISFIF